MLLLGRISNTLIDVPSPASKILPLAQQRDRTLLKGFAWVGNHQVTIKGKHFAQTVAAFAHSLRTVKAKHLRSRWRKT